VALADDIGNLILRLNPYTNRTIPDTIPPRSTGGMDIYLRNTHPTGTHPHALADAEVELEGPYLQDWSFKGQPQKVGMAARIKYRYPVTDSTGTLYYVDDYLLIGFQGSMGG
jgi:hypothetical protein